MHFQYLFVTLPKINISSKRKQQNNDTANIFQTTGKTTWLPSRDKGDNGTSAETTAKDRTAQPLRPAHLMRTVDKRECRSRREKRHGENHEPCGKGK